MTDLLSLKKPLILFLPRTVTGSDLEKLKSAPNKRKNKAIEAKDGSSSVIKIPLFLFRILVNVLRKPRILIIYSLNQPIKE